MICERTVKRYCSEDISLIENYWDAVNDETQVWECHHKNEIFRGIGVSRELLIDIGLYYGCPSSELIFLTRAEHNKLHKSGDRHPFFGKKHSCETKKRMSEARKGERNHNFGKHHSEETKRKISEARKAYYAKKR